MTETLSPFALSAAARIMEMSYTSLVNYRALYAFAKLGIADVLRDRQATSDEIAAATGANPRALYRLLRALSNAEVVSESDDHRFSLTPIGSLLRTDAPGSMQAWVIFSGELFYLQAWEQILHSVYTGRPAWDHVHQMPFFKYLRENRDAARIFDDAMTSLTYGEAQAVVEAYDFSHVGTLVDIGGGLGRLLETALLAIPNLRGVLFDQPQVTEAARDRILQIGLADRCRVVGGDFFESVPAGGDAYLMKYILHDWDDEHCASILRNCRRAMHPDARVLIVETVVPAPGERHFAKIADLEMLVLLGSQERTLEEYRLLLDRANLKIERVIPTNEPLSIIEAVAA